MTFPPNQLIGCKSPDEGNIGKKNHRANNMECILKEAQDLSGAGITAMVIGQVQHISVEEQYAQGYEPRYGKEGYMLLIPAPQDLITGKPNQSAIATINIEKYD